MWLTRASESVSRLRGKRLNTVLRERDARVIDAARELGVSEGIALGLADRLRDDRQARLPSDQVEEYLGLSNEALSLVTTLVESELSKETVRVKALLNKLEKTEGELQTLERQMSAIPEEDALAELVRNREKGRLSFEKARAQLKFLQDEIEELNRSIMATEAELKAQHRKWFEQDLETEEAARVAAYAGNIQSTLDQFRVAVVERNVRRIESLVLESFQSLVHKERLISDVTINPKSFEITLRGADGDDLPPDRLSAGERQLLAVAMLWALRRAVGRPLPVVIDTPLGRLDSAHRQSVVRRYFPQASHQVLLLSTDEEIDRSHHKALKKSLAHSYLLNFDDSDCTTTIQPGYFWQ